MRKKGKGHKIGENSSPNSIRKPSPQKVVSDAAEHEETNKPVIKIDALRALGRIVRGIIHRIKAKQQGNGSKND